MAGINFGRASLSPLSATGRHAWKPKKVSLWSLLIVLIFAILALQLTLSWHFFSASSSAPAAANTADSRATTRSWRTMRHEVPHSIDATFNGAPLQLTTLEKPPSSRLHCVGDNYRADGTTDWKQRSCRFWNLCFNVTNKRYVVFQSAPEQSLSRVLMAEKHFHIASIMAAAPPNQTQAVSMGGINQKWGGQNIPRLKWFPDIINIDGNVTRDPQMLATSGPLTFYALPRSVVLLPYHSLNGANPGHAVWDDFLSLYTLLDMFDLLELEPLLMRYVLDDGERGMWASCDLRNDKTAMCAKILNKFAPMLMGLPTSNHDNGHTWSTTQDFKLQTMNGKEPASDLVCASHGAAGIGSLTDHGVFKSHGWEEKDYETTHNHGRGGLMRRFRQHVMENLGLGHLAVVPTEAPHRVIISQSSSSIPARNLKLDLEMEMLKEGLPNANVEPYTFKKMSLVDQLRIAGEAAVYITPCGGGAVTGMFLPKGASLIIYYQHNGGVQNNRGTRKPALLDWDLFSAMSHLRVHWFPMAMRKDYVGQAGLLFLVRHELYLIESLDF